jgi:isopenicillin-N N-acyltransferase like protein
MATQSIPVVEVRGSPRERGRTHGEALRSQIAAVREQWRESLTARFGIDASAFIDRFLAQTRFVDAIRRWTPALLEEIDGIAAGSGRPRDETLAFQFMDEEWWFGAARLRRTPAAANRCSIVASRGRDGTPPILAQNMDLHGFLDGGQAVIRVRGSGGEPDATILTIAGMIALCGANDAGLGVAVNTLWQLPSAVDGLPVACVARTILSRRNLSDAREWIASVRHASGQHYLIGDPDGFASFEASGARVSEVPWSAAVPAYVHTNHPLTGGRAAPGNPAEENSRGRYATLCGLVAGKSLTVEEVKSALGDRSGSHPISVRRNADNPGATMTFASIVMELTRPPAIQIAGGPPCSYPWRRISASN